jgi:hypothetical protein
MTTTNTGIVRSQRRFGAIEGSSRSAERDKRGPEFGPGAEMSVRRRGAPVRRPIRGTERQGARRANVREAEERTMLSL